MDCQNMRWNEITDYREAEQYINAIPEFTKKNGMEDTKAFLHFLVEKTGHSHHELYGKIIHVAGTNGKGSVCAYINAVLNAAGYRTGLFTSPHLVTMRERFKIADVMIEEADFTHIFLLVMERVEKFTKERQTAYHPTFFELLFFMAVLFFLENGAEYIIMETGLGGRLDTTNCIEKPLVTVITEIGLDHTEYLGDTVEQIASEKAGIIKKGVPLVYWSGRKEAADVLKKRAEEVETMAVPVSLQDIQALNFHKKCIAFSMESRYYNNIRVTLSSPALYQTENAALAVRALELIGKGTIPEECLAEGMYRTKWEGRMEEILPDVFLDGAHNEDGIQALLTTVRQDGCEGKRVLLFGVMQDKLHDKMIKLLTKAQLFDTIVLTEVNNGRTLKEEQLKHEFAQNTEKEILYFDNAEDAFAFVTEHKETKDRIYISGSLYLAGQIKAVLRRNSND